MTWRTNIYNRYIKDSSQGVWAKPSLNKYQLELGSNADWPTRIQAQLDRLVNIDAKEEEEEPLENKSSGVVMSVSPQMEL